MRFAARGVALILVLAGFVVSPPHPSASATTSGSKTVTVIVYGSPTTTTTTVPVRIPGLEHRVEPPLVSPDVMAKWQRVAWCESHQNWHQVHPGAHAFSGGIGMRNDVWWEFGGRQFAEYSGQATPEQQVLVARRVQASAGVGEYVPDQTGCNGSW